MAEFVAFRSWIDTVFIVVPLFTTLCVLLSCTPLLVAVAVEMLSLVPLAMPKLPALPTPVEDPLLVIVPLLVDWAAAPVAGRTPTITAAQEETKSNFVISTPVCTSRRTNVG